VKWFLLTPVIVLVVGLKVHHDGLAREQPEQLAADVGVPGIKEDIEESDMVEVNGASGHGKENGNGYDEQTQTA
jgi:hypothetical protein